VNIYKDAGGRGGEGRGEEEGDISTEAGMSGNKEKVGTII